MRPIDLRSAPSPLSSRPSCRTPSTGEYRVDLRNVRSAYPRDRLLDALAQRARGTLCCHGAPGTGKTVLAAHIAERTGRRLQKVTAGDLLSPYVGESARNIARLFREAADPDTVLRIDEAEGLLASRTGGQRRREFSLTNEFLRRIEAFPGILVAATNLASARDEAFMRRFQFKGELQALRPHPRIACGTLRLGAAAVDATVAAGLVRLDGLTLGDFTTVDRPFGLMGERPAPAGVLAALQAELAAREAACPRRIGFLS
jgi:hypothetical protein